MAIHAPCGTERDGKTVREFGEAVRDRHFCAQRDDRNRDATGIRAVKRVLMLVPEP